MVSVAVHIVGARDCTTLRNRGMSVNTSFTAGNIDLASEVTKAFSSSVYECTSDNASDVAELATTEIDNLFDRVNSLERTSTRLLNSTLQARARFDGAGWILESPGNDKSVIPISFGTITISNSETGYWRKQEKYKTVTALLAALTGYNDYQSKPKFFPGTSVRNVNGNADKAAGEYIRVFFHELGLDVKRSGGYTGFSYDVLAKHAQEVIIAVEANEGKLTDFITEYDEWKGKDVVKYINSDNALQKLHTRLTHKSIRAWGSAFSDQQRIPSFKDCSPEMKARLGIVLLSTYAAMKVKTKK